MRWPVSVKGVVWVGDRVVLAHNSRKQWELPGGRLDRHESMEAGLAREIREETALDAVIGPLVGAYVFDAIPHKRVVVLAYGCAAGAEQAPSASAEHSEVTLFAAAELADLVIPERYRDAIAHWSADDAAQLLQ
ncbi:MAG TPA: NUDIX hydrolase [Jatrophihabitantaceae bacterium]